MIKIKQNSILAFFIFCTPLISLQAQEKSTKLANDLSTLIDKSNNFQEYKVIKKEAITTFQKSLDNYISQEKSIQTNLENEIKANSELIKILENELKTYTSNNKKLMTEKSNIGFLGFSVNKSNYSVIMWTLFLVTLAIALVLFFSFKKANKVTKETKVILADLEEEYQSFRGVSVEREQNLRRQLFDEVKKKK